MGEARPMENPTTASPLSIFCFAVLIFNLEILLCDVVSVKCDVRYLQVSVLALGSSPS
jgi:hypothetical protein